MNRECEMKNCVLRFALRFFPAVLSAKPPQVPSTRRYMLLLPQKEHICGSSCRSKGTWKTKKLNQSISRVNQSLSQISVSVHQSQSQSISRSPSVSQSVSQPVVNDGSARQAGRPLHSSFVRCVCASVEMVGPSDGRSDDG